MKKELQLKGDWDRIEAIAWYTAIFRDEQKGVYNWKLSGRHQPEQWSPAMRMWKLNPPTD